MAIRPEDEFTNHTPADANYPDGSFKSESTPGALDGSPLSIVWGNDLLGILQKILAVAGVTPSGNPDTVLLSDYFDALELAFQRFLVYADSGAADTYVLTSPALANGGTGVDSYADGVPIFFKAAASNTGASTVNVDGIGVKNIRLSGGAVLPADTIQAGKYVQMVFNLTSDRFEVVSAAAELSFNDATVGYTAMTIQAALEEVVKRANHTGAQAVATLSDHNKAAHDSLAINADTLDGQHGSYYQSASNLTAGTLPAARFNDTAHGARAGGSLHAVAIASGAAGFLTGADKAKLDGLSATSGDVVAWTTFDGTATTPAPSAGSLNVASITDNGNGDYVVNLTSTLGSTDYAVSVCTNDADASYFGGMHGTSSKTATAIHVLNWFAGVGGRDPVVMDVMATQ